MELAFLKSVLVWSAVLNAGFLAVWFIIYSFARHWVFRMHSRWHPITEEQFNGIHYSGMMIYKMAIFLLFICPYVAILLSE